MRRFVPTLQQLDQARGHLPSPYSMASARGPVYRVALPMESSALLYDPYRGDAEFAFNQGVIDFRLDDRTDPDGFTWKRWVYDGPVAV